MSPHKLIDYSAQSYPTLVSQHLISNPFPNFYDFLLQQLKRNGEFSIENGH